MKRFHLTYALAWLLGTAGAHTAAQTPAAAGVADPQAPVPATRYQPAVADRANPAPAASGMPMHEHRAGMRMDAGACKEGCCGHREEP